MRRMLIAAFSCLPLAACMTEDVLYYDGVTTAAGDAIAANTVMQMVDPWPAGVEETRLRTPLVRPEPRPATSGTDTTVADD